ncbi:MAG: hypothetical protein R3E66_11040 [bacterium]
MRTWIILLLLCGLASPAVAQTRAEKKQIKALNEAGITAFQEGRFADAAASFREAWKIHPDPTLRKNEAIAWFKANNCKEASEAATSFLDAADTDPEARGEINSVLANCRVEYAREAMRFKDFKLAEDFLAQAENLATADVTKENIRQARLELAKARSEVEAPVEATPTVVTANAEPTQPVWPYVVAGTGAAIVLTAAIYHVVSLTSTASEYEDVAAAGRDKARYNELASSLDTARWLVPTLYAVGLATTGVGAYFVFGREDTATTPAAPTSAGVTFSGSF